MKLPRKKTQEKYKAIQFCTQRNIKTAKKKIKRRNYFDCFLSSIERASANIVLCVQKAKTKKKYGKTNMRKIATNSPKQNKQKKFGNQIYAAKCGK